MGFIDTIISIIQPTPIPVPVILPMKRVLCKKHQTYIVIHKFEEETLFVDDDKKEVTIFTDNKGKRYLKRYVVDGCNENCETVVECLK